MTTRLTRVNPMSFALVSALLYALLATVFAIIVALLWAAGMPMGGMAPDAKWLIVLVPFIYFVVGYIGGLITAWFFNIAAGWAGGIEITLQSKTDA